MGCKGKGSHSVVHTVDGSDLLSVLQHLTCHVLWHPVAIGSLEGHHSIDTIYQVTTFREEVEAVLGSYLFYGILLDCL